MAYSQALCRMARVRRPVDAAAARPLRRVAATSSTAHREERSGLEITGVVPRNLPEPGRSSPLKGLSRHTAGFAGPAPIRCATITAATRHETGKHQVMMASTQIHGLSHYISTKAR